MHNNSLIDEWNRNFGMSEPFAKLFDTPHGQLLAFLDTTDDEEPSISLIGAPVRGVVARAALSGWGDGEDGQLRDFDAIDQAKAEETAATLYAAADKFAPGDGE